MNRAPPARYQRWTPPLGVCTDRVGGACSRLSARRTRHSSSSTSTPVRTRSASGTAVRSMPGSTDSRSGRRWWWSSRSMTTRPDGPVAMPTAKVRPRHQRRISSGSVVAARTPWHHRPAARQPQPPAPTSGNPQGGRPPGVGGRHRRQLPAGCFDPGSSGWTHHPLPAHRVASSSPLLTPHPPPPGPGRAAPAPERSRPPAAGPRTGPSAPANHRPGAGP